MTQPKEKRVALSPEVLSKVRDLIACCMEHPVESPQVAKKVLELISPEPPKKPTELFVHRVIEEVFGPLMQNLPLAVRT